MRYDKMSSFIVMDIVREAQKFSDSIHFEIGQPDLPPSPKVKAKMQKAIEEDRFSYTESKGLITLREKISNMYKTTYGINVNPQRIILTAGTSGAFLVAYTLTLKHHQNIGLSNPSYPCYKNFAFMLDINPHFMNVDSSTNYELTPTHLKGQNIQALQISSPANPTGNIYKKENLKALIEYCDQNHIAFISDELYHGLTYDVNVNTALEFSQNAFVINGFSKYYCLPGARLGWIIVPENLVRKAEIIAQNIFISAPTLSQYGCLGAFDEEYLEKVKKTFQKRRDFLYNELSELFTIDAKPDGAFYLWADISKYHENSFTFAKELLQNIHVATTPGIDFGSNQTHKYLRFAYTREIDHMKEGIKRFKNYLK